MKMVTKKKIKFQCADPWLLLSIIYANGDSKSDLTTIIGYGDFINHAIFTLQEIQGGMYRLIHSGYVVKKKNLYLPSSRILDAYNKFAKKNKVVIKQLDFIRQELNAPEWSSKYDPTNANRDGICKEINKKTLDLAYSLYKKSMSLCNATG